MVEELRFMLVEVIFRSTKEEQHAFNAVDAVNDLISFVMLLYRKKSLHKKTVN